MVPAKSSKAEIVGLSGSAVRAGLRCFDGDTRALPAALHSSGPFPALATRQRSWGNVDA